MPVLRHTPHFSACSHQYWAVDEPQNIIVTVNWVEQSNEKLFGISSSNEAAVESFFFFFFLHELPLSRHYFLLNTWSDKTGLHTKVKCHRVSSYFEESAHIRRFFIRIYSTTWMNYCMTVTELDHISTYKVIQMTNKWTKQTNKNQTTYTCTCSTWVKEADWEKD